MGTINCNLASNNCKIHKESLEVIVSEEDDDMISLGMEEFDSSVKLCSPNQSRQRDIIMSFNTVSRDTTSKIPVEVSEKY